MSLPSFQTWLLAVHLMYTVREGIASLWETEMSFFFFQLKKIVKKNPNILDQFWAKKRRKKARDFSTFYLESRPGFQVYFTTKPSGFSAKFHWKPAGSGPGFDPVSWPEKTGRILGRDVWRETGRLAAGFTSPLLRGAATLNISRLLICLDFPVCCDK